jgi:hypothetical protein
MPAPDAAVFSFDGVVIDSRLRQAREQPARDPTAPFSPSLPEFGVF